MSELGFTVCFYLEWSQKLDITQGYYHISPKLRTHQLQDVPLYAIKKEKKKRKKPIQYCKVISLHLK